MIQLSTWINIILFILLSLLEKIQFPLMMPCHEDKWNEAMQEIKSIEKNETWELTNLTCTQEIHRCKMSVQDKEES